MEQLKLFAAERRRLLAAAPDRIEVRLKDFELHRPRQWGGCWLFSELCKELQLDAFWRARLGFSREDTDWEHVLQVLVCYRLLDPGSEWRLHRVWFEQSALGDLLAEDFSIAAKDTLYRCLDSLVEHKAELFEFLHQRWAAPRSGRTNGSQPAANCGYAVRWYVRLPTDPKTLPKRGSSDSQERVWIAGASSVSLQT